MAAKPVHGLAEPRVNRARLVVRGGPPAQTAARRTVVLQNPGRFPNHLAFIYLSGPSKAHFRLARLPRLYPDGVVLAPRAGTSVAFDIAYEPIVGGAELSAGKFHQAKLVIVSDAGVTLVGLSGLALGGLLTGKTDDRRRIEFR